MWSERYLGRRRDVEGIPWPLKGTGADPCPLHPRPELRPRLTNTKTNYFGLGKLEKDPYSFTVHLPLQEKHSNRAYAALKSSHTNLNCQKRLPVLHNQVSSSLKLSYRCLRRYVGIRCTRYQGTGNDTGTN
jgi:hypothetical protein